LQFEKQPKPSGVETAFLLLSKTLKNGKKTETQPKLNRKFTETIPKKYRNYTETLSELCQCCVRVTIDLRPCCFLALKKSLDGLQPMRVLIQLLIKNAGLVEIVDAHLA